LQVPISMHGLRVLKRQMGSCRRHWWMHNLRCKEWRKPEGRNDWKAPPLAREEESVEARRRRDKRSFIFIRIIEEDDDDVGFSFQLFVLIPWFLVVTIMSLMWRKILKFFFLSNLVTFCYWAWASIITNLCENFSSSLPRFFYTP
jgi:hypothetical protein